MTCTPLIGQHVHYIHWPPNTPPPTTWHCQPAIITSTIDNNTPHPALRLFIPTDHGTIHATATHSPKPQPGTWHWPDPTHDHQRIIEALKTITHGDLQ